MTPDEYQNWLNRFMSAFPDVGTWMEKKSNAKDVADDWEEQLSVLTLDALDAVLGRLKMDVEKPLPAYENQNWPRYLRRLVGEHVARRAAAEEAELRSERYAGRESIQQEYQRPKALLGLAEATLQAIEMYENGATKEEVNRWCEENVR